MNATANTIPDYTGGSDESPSPGRLSRTIEVGLASLPVGMQETPLENDFHPTETFWLRGLCGTQRAQQLAMPLRIDVTTDPDDGAIIVIAPFVRCAGSGENIYDALIDLSDAIFSLHAEFANSPDEQLADDARTLKSRFSLLF